MTTASGRQRPRSGPWQDCTLGQGSGSCALASTVLASGRPQASVTACAAPAATLARTPQLGGPRVLTLGGFGWAAESCLLPIPVCRQG